MSQILGMQQTSGSIFKTIAGKSINEEGDVGFEDKFGDILDDRDCNENDDGKAGQNVAIEEEKENVNIKEEENDDGKAGQNRVIENGD